MTAAQHRTSTIMCADLPDGEHVEALADVARANSAVVIRASDDALLCAFDSASAAVAASIEMQRAGVTDSSPSAMRIGLAAGDVVWSDGSCSGAAVDVAAALVTHAEPAQIVVNNVVRWLATEATGTGYAPLGSIELDGIGEAVGIFAVEWQPLTPIAPPAALAEGVSVPLPAGIATAVRQTLVGRDAEWEVLGEAWRRVRAGGREVVLIGGEAGAGKTRFASEFGRRCHDEGAIVLLGTCDAELALPYQPWVHALDHLLRSLPGFGRALVGDRDLGDLLVLLPQLERMLPNLQRTPGADPETERYLLFSAVDRVLASAAQLAPVVLLLDDIHWAGRQTLELLRHLVRAGSASRLMIVATFRDAAADLTDQLADCLGDLQRTEFVSRLSLGSLDAASVELFIARTLDQELDDDLRRMAATLGDRTGGNPFFLGELWRHLAHHGVVARAHERWVVRRDVTTIGAPDSVHDVVATRMARLSRRARRLLELGAVAGQRFELGVMSLAAEAAVDDVSAGLDELVDSGFLVDVGGRLAIYEFTHALVRDTVEEAMSKSARARLHLRIGEAIEHVYAGDARSVYAELAHHFSAAAAVGGAQQAIIYGRRAADQANASAAYDEAISQLEVVLQLLPTEGSEAVDALNDLGQVQMRMGQSFKAQDTYQRAFEEARRGGWAELASIAAMGFEESVHQPGAPGGPAVKMVSEAIDMLGDADPRLRARLQSSLARSLQLAGERSAAVEAAATAVQMARSVDDLECLAAALQATTIMMTDPAQIIEASTELRDVALRIGDHWSAVYATGNLCRVLIALGRLDQAAEILQQHRMMSDRGRFLVFQFMGHVYEAVLALAAGNLDVAEEAAERAHAVADSNNAVFGEGVYGLQMFAIRREQGRLAEVLPLMRLLSTRHDDQAIWRPGLAALYAELGMIEEASHELEALSPGGFASVARDEVWPACLTFLAEACVACGNTAHASTLLHELDAFAGRNMMVAMTICFGPADRLRGGLARVLGLHDEAESHFQAAAALADRSGSPLWRAHVLYDWASLAAGRNDLARAGAMADEALTIATDLGMATLAARAGEVVRGTPKSTWVAEVADGLSQRELEVLALIAAGCSNKEIGARLFISQHTAANHVRSILQKTGCANRAEAAAYAVHRHIHHLSPASPPLGV